MARREINIELRADGSKAVGEFGKVGKASRDLIVNVKKIGGAFGELGGLLGDLSSNILKGGVWGVMNAVVQAGVGLFQRWRDSAKEAAKASEEAVQKMADGVKSAVAEINSAYSTATSAADKWLAKTEKQIETTKRLAVAEQELAKQRALASGDKAGAAKADENIAVIKAKSEAEAEAARVKGYERRRAAAEEAARKAERELDKAAAKVEEVNARRQAMLGDPGRRGDRSVSYKPGDESSAWGRANREAVGWAGLRNGQRIALLAQNRGSEWDAMVKDYRDRVFREERKKVLESDDWKSATNELKTSMEASGKASDALFEMRQRLADIDAEEKRRLKENEAKRIESAARQVADDSAAEIAAAKAAAQERDRLDRELHAKRMADLRAEIAAQKDAASPLRVAAAVAQSEFERAFAMYRDPTRAASEIAEERDRAADLKQLHRDASRYGGKWRIDELSALMSAGDSAGVQSRLEDWRKSRSFSPEVEAMVRASAAERTRTTVEDELRKIETNTSGLAQKLDELLKMKE